MSKDIDFEFGRSIGATHYRKIDSNPYVDWYKEGDSEILYWSYSKWAWDSGEAWFFDSTKIPPADPWTIHNNEKPLCELSDEQAAQLFNAWRCGSEVVSLSPKAVIIANSPMWNPECTYRIKPKSERDTFIQQCVGLMTSETERFQDQMFAEVFDAIQRGDIKAPEVRK